LVIETGQLAIKLRNQKLNYLEECEHLYNKIKVTFILFKNFDNI